MLRPEKIPVSLWEDTDYFDLSISQLAQVLLQIPSDELMVKLMSMRADLYQQSTQECCCCWLAIAYGHPDLSDDILLFCNGLFRLSSQDTIILAGVLGKLSYFEKLTKELSTSLRTLVEEHYLDRAIGKAIRHEHIDLIPALEGVVSKWPGLRGGPVCIPQLSSIQAEAEFARALIEHGVFSVKGDGVIPEVNHEQRFSPDHY